MKFSSRTKFNISIFLVVIVSLVYVFLIKIGLEKQNIDLKKTIKTFGIVEDFGTDYHYNSRGKSSKVFFIKLNNLNEKIGVYRVSKNYDNLINSLKVNDRITVYYYTNNNNQENVNIDLIQIEKNNKILLSKSEYEKKDFSLIYIGILGIITNVVIIYYNRKKYLKRFKK